MPTIATAKNKRIFILHTKVRKKNENAILFAAKYCLGREDSNEKKGALNQ
jgi:hypothetical protein